MLRFGFKVFAMTRCSCNTEQGDLQGAFKCKQLGYSHGSSNASCDKAGDVFFPPLSEWFSHGVIGLE